MSLTNSSDWSKLPCDFGFCRLREFENLLSCFASGAALRLLVVVCSFRPLKKLTDYTGIFDFKGMKTIKNYF